MAITPSDPKFPTPYGAGAKYLPADRAGPGLGWHLHPRAPEVFEQREAVH